MCNNVKIKKRSKDPKLPLFQQHVFFARKPPYFLKTNPRRTEELFDDAERSRNSRRIISFSLLTRGTLEIFPLELPEFFFIGSARKHEAVGLNYRRRRRA